MESYCGELLLFNIRRVIVFGFHNRESHFWPVFSRLKNGVVLASYYSTVATGPEYACVQASINSSNVE